MDLEKKKRGFYQKRNFTPILSNNMCRGEEILRKCFYVTEHEHLKFARQLQNAFK